MPEKFGRKSNPTNPWQCHTLKFPIPRCE
jgi:hypothetical protein